MFGGGSGFGKRHGLCRICLWRLNNSAALDVLDGANEVLGAAETIRDSLGQQFFQNRLQPTKPYR